MKNNQTSKNEKHQHAVIVCAIRAARGNVHTIDYKLNDLVSFCLENGKQKFGRIVRIQANISKIKTEKEPFVTYTIIDENGDLFERPASEVKR